MEDISIAVMGATGSGKTTFVNLASGSDFATGPGLQSCTSAIQMTQQFELDGRSVSLIDSPGFDDTTRSDVDILRMIAEYLAKAYKDGKKLSGVIYVHRISDFRMSGISQRNFKMFRELCGEKTLVNVTELATQEIFFKPTLDKGAKMLRHDATRDSANGVLRYILGNHPLPLQIQREIVDQAKDISETWKIAEGNSRSVKSLTKQTKRRDGSQKASRGNPEVEAESRQLAADFERRKREAERSMQEAAENSRREAERAAAEFQRQAREIQEATESARRQAEHAAAELKRQAHIIQQQQTQRPTVGRQVEEGGKRIFREIRRPFRRF
ncbi:P-loop containing nucleoside triphosphate hydrolase protein [Flammula alnicola]|nr:P-loop containing nucleoside triphosphate hydrolase protein [Flammula alnicola]